jgi:hypothetical protein
MIRWLTGIGVLFCGMLLIRAEPATAGCTRESLQAAAESYIAAQEAGDAFKMVLVSPLIRITQNMKEVTREDAFFNKAMPIAMHRNYLDVDTCRTFSEVVVVKGEKPCVLGVRLSVDNGRITGVDLLITKNGDWLFDAVGYMGYSRIEDWSPLPEKQRPTRQALIGAANAYLDIFHDKDANVPWGIPCARLEGGSYTNPNNAPNAGCKVGVPEEKVVLGSRSYVVDVELGAVQVFTRFSSVNGPPDSHLLRLVNGKIRYVHTLTVMGQTPGPTAPKTPAK